MFEKLPKGILFDLGDTIFRTEEFSTQRGTEHLLTMAENPLNTTADEIEAYGNEIRNAMVPLRERSFIEFPTFAFQRLLYEKFDITFPLTPEEIELEFWKAATKHTLEEGIPELLDFLKQNDVKMAIVSNTSFRGDILSWELKRHNLWDKFEFIMASCDYGLRKPHPMFFKTAIAKFKLPIDDVWFAGNSFEQDVEGSVNVGLKAIWYNIEDNLPSSFDVDYVEIKNWQELLDMLKQG